MSGIGSPTFIEILLHFYTSRAPLPHIDAPVTQMAVEYFLSVGAIVPTSEEPTYRTTDLGVAWVRALCNTPPPVPAFVDEMVRVIKHQQVSPTTMLDNVPEASA